jgi:hypothetical protein
LVQFLFLHFLFSLSMGFAGYRFVTGFLWNLVDGWMIGRPDWLRDGWWGWRFLVRLEMEVVWRILFLVLAVFCPSIGF